MNEKSKGNEGNVAIDTLLGVVAAELNQELGDPETNPHEAHHKGDDGISDITLTIMPKP
jgi:hypothetical protein